MRRTYWIAIFWSAVCLGVAGKTAKNQAIVMSDPQAIAFAVQATANLTGDNVVSDATLSVSVTSIAGSETLTGTGTMYAKGTLESRVDLSLNGTTTSTIRNLTGLFPQGETIAQDGTVQPAAMHNCWLSPSWFSPVSSFLTATTDPTLIFSYVGQETRGTRSVQHLRAYRNFNSPNPHFVAITQAVSTADFYLDAATLLPVAITFNGHPDDDAGTNIPMEVDILAYQSVNGVQMPLHIQQLISDGLALDVVVNSVALNSGLSDSLFAIQ
ncbi:MAG TPA: hypothetical protein VFA89_10930 [Terriglobales bacterium]|nr:hypothetical protein [Terriglobales bacterium]